MRQHFVCLAKHDGADALVLAMTRLVAAQFAFFIPKTGSKDDPIVVQVRSS